MVFNEGFGMDIDVKHLTAKSSDVDFCEGTKGF